jgi:26S proteasome regulatory subunit N5
VELFLCSMITSGTVTGRIDRPSGVVSFLKTKDPSEALNDWAQNLDKLMSLISNATHLINKEEMVHKHLNQPIPSVASSSATNKA